MMTRSISITTRFLSLALLSLTLPAFGQVPKVGAVFPPGVRRGATTSMTLSGENLKPGSRVLVSGEGVAATVSGGGDEKSVTLTVTAEADAASGVRELRILGPN